MVNATLYYQFDIGELQPLTWVVRGNLVARKQIENFLTSFWNKSGEKSGDIDG
jgi:hypothetical protein